MLRRADWRPVQLGPVDASAQKPEQLELPFTAPSGGEWS